MSLTGKERHKLRAVGHHQKVLVQVGQNGITPGLIMAVEQALYDHELIKVKMPEGREEREAMVEQLSKETGADVAQTLGRTVLLFKQRPQKSRFDLSRDQGDIQLPPEAVQNQGKARTSAPKRLASRPPRPGGPKAKREASARGGRGAEARGGRSERPGRPERAPRQRRHRES